MTGDEPTSPLAGKAPVPPVLPQIPDHQLLRCIGSGAYGQIWLVRSVLGAYRAAKVVFRGRFESERPFQREFCGIQSYEPLSRSHEGLVNILQVGKNDAGGYFYYLMELADDQITRRSIDPETYLAKTVGGEIGLRGRLPAAECVDIALAVTSALHHLHGRGLVHRDIKPENLIYVEGRVKLADIGLVAEVGASQTNVGTDGFSPPEGSGTPQADLYAVGKLLYEMATGKDRFSFPEPSTSLGEFADRREVQQLSRVIHRACDPNPARRYHSAREMHRDLLRLQGQRAAVGGPWWRKPVAIAVGIATGVLGLFFLLMLIAGLASISNARGVRVRDWVGPTTDLGPAYLTGGELLPEPAADLGHLAVSVTLGREAFDAVATPGTVAPGGKEVDSDSATSWRVRQRAEWYGLQSGLSTWRGIRIACRSEQEGVSSEVIDGGSECLVHAQVPPSTLEVAVVFLVPRDLKPEACRLHYQHGLAPLIMPMIRDAGPEK